VRYYYPSLPLGFEITAALCFGALEYCRIFLGTRQRCVCPHEVFLTNSLKFVSSVARQQNGELAAAAYLNAAARPDVRVLLLPARAADLRVSFPPSPHPFLRTLAHLVFLSFSCIANRLRVDLITNSIGVAITGLETLFVVLMAINLRYSYRRL
jgi:hypothetical protein